MQKTTCPKCDYTWETKSEMFYVTCPKCLRKIEIREKDKEDGENGRT